jgi:hypothetical protein
VTDEDVGSARSPRATRLAVALAERFRRVIATDPAQAQLNRAIAHPRVEHRRAPAEVATLGLRP